MGHTQELVIFTQLRIVFAIMATVSLIVFAPLAARALGVGSANGAVATTAQTSATDEADAIPNHKKRLHNLKAIQSSDNTAASTTRENPDTSAVDLDSNLATTPAPLGGTNKSALGVGVEARMPGASGR